MIDKFVVWWLTRRVMKRYNLPKSQRLQVKTLVLGEYSGLPSVVYFAQEYQRSEAEILDARLSRGFDPARALSEATQRAIAKKRENVDVLTPQQKAALEYQKGHMKRIVERS